MVSFFEGDLLVSRLSYAIYGKNVICALANSHLDEFFNLSLQSSDIHKYFFVLPFLLIKNYLKNHTKALRDNPIIVLCHVLKTTPYYKSLDLMDFFCKHCFKFPLRRKHVHWVFTCALSNVRWKRQLCKGYKTLHSKHTQMLFIKISLLFIWLYQKVFQVKALFLFPRKMFNFKSLSQENSQRLVQTYHARMFYWRCKLLWRQMLYL